MWGQEWGGFARWASVVEVGQQPAPGGECCRNGCSDCPPRLPGLSPGASLRHDAHHLAPAAGRSGWQLFGRCCSGAPLCCVPSAYVVGVAEADLNRISTEQAVEGHWRPHVCVCVCVTWKERGLKMGSNCKQRTTEQGGEVCGVANLTRREDSFFDWPPSSSEAANCTVCHRVPKLLLSSVGCVQRSLVELRAEL